MKSHYIRSGEEEDQGNSRDHGQEATDNPLNGETLAAEGAEPKRSEVIADGDNYTGEYLMTRVPAIEGCPRVSPSLFASRWTARKDCPHSLPLK
jgi:hypothetical protein